MGVKVLSVAVVAALILTGLVVRAQTAGGATKTDNTPTGNAQNGKRVFEAEVCGKCHGSQGEGKPNQEEAAPRIGPTRLSLPLFARFVRNPTGKMPAYAANVVPDGELADLYAFLQELAPAPKAGIASANGQNGQRLYTSYGCYECHGNEGQGATQTGGSRIGPIRISFPAFVTYVRQPTGQMPPYAVKAVTDADLADIYVFLESRPESAPAESILLLME